VLGVEIKRDSIYGILTVIYFKIDVSSATSFKRSRRELSIDVAEKRFILKNF